MARPDPVSVVAGIAVIVLGVLLLADAVGAISLTFALLAPAACAAAGAILLAHGLNRRD
jgi:hypothetical protein